MRIRLIYGDGLPFAKWGPDGDDAAFIRDTHGLPRRSHPERPEWIRPYNPAAWDLSLGVLPKRHHTLLRHLVEHPDLWFYVEPDGRSGIGTV